MNSCIFEVSFKRVLQVNYQILNGLAQLFIWLRFDLHNFQHRNKEKWIGLVLSWYRLSSQCIKKQNLSYILFWWVLIVIFDNCPVRNFDQLQIFIWQELLCLHFKYKIYAKDIKCIISNNITISLLNSKHSYFNNENLLLFMLLLNK